MKSPLRAILTLVAWSILAIFLLAVLNIWWLLVIANLALCARRLRRRRTVLLTAILESIMRLKLPLVPSLRSLDLDEGMVLNHRLNALSNRLADGTTLAVALGETVPELSPRDVALIGAAEKSGRVLPTLSRLARRNAINHYSEPDNNGLVSKMYPLLIVACIMAAGSVVSVFVMPKYIEILRDFNLPIPRLTVWFYELRDLFTSTFFLWILLIILMYGALLRSIWKPRRLSQMVKLPNDLLWCMPLYGTIVRSRGMGDVCQVLGDAVEAGQSIDKAVQDASELEVNSVLKRRLRQWAKRMREGESIDSAARNAHMPAMMTRLIATAQTTDAASAVFQFLQKYYDTRCARYETLLRGVGFPVVLLCLAGVVLCVILALFQPMVDMIDYLSVAAFVL